MRVLRRRDRPPVDLGDRDDAGAGAGEEDRVRGVQLHRPDVALDDRDAELRSELEIVRRVIPGSAARVVGVTSTPSETMNRFVEVHSATAPRWSSMTASSSPAAFACCFAMIASR